MAVTVLIVDDSLAFRRLLRVRLEPLGYRIIGDAGTAKEGLELFRKTKPDLVTLDLMMPDKPDFTARDLFARLREEAPNTVVVVISSQSISGNASDYLDHGATAYLDKSFINFDAMHKRLSAIFPELRRGLRGRLVR